MRALQRPFEKVPAATSAPWACICGKCQGEMVRTHLQLPGGEGYIGPDCLADFVALYGWAPLETHQALQREHVAVNERLTESQAAFDVSEQRAAALELEVERLTGEVAQMTDERAAVSADQERSGRELNELRVQLARTADQRSAQTGVDAAVAGKRPKQKERQAA